MAKRFRFSGKELDPESGLYFFGARYLARYLAPWLGRWLGRWTAADPVIRPSSRYDYTANNPIRLMDPDGRDPVVLVPPSYLETHNRYGTIEYFTLEKKVGNLEDSDGTKVLTTEEKASGLVNIGTEKHYEAVKKVVNEAIMIATEHFRDENTRKLTETHDKILQ